MNPASANDTIVQEIIIRGSAERIFQALTDPAQRMKWWGAEGRFQVAHMESDLRVGGAWMMSGMGMGRPFQVRGVYREVAPPYRLVFTWLPSWQGDSLESLVRFDIEENNGIATVRLTHSGLTSESSRQSHKGWPQILGWLQAYVEAQA